MPLKIEHCPEPALSPNKDIPWADTKVCKPGFIKDPKADRLRALSASLMRMKNYE